MATNFDVPNQDFVGFSYGQWHCIRNGHIYRTSDGNRYNKNLIPALTDKTADIPGADGQYFFGSFHKSRTFTINFAFDELDEGRFNALSEVFNGKDIKDLIFDEQPYKAYDAKVTGTPSIKFISFDDDLGNRVYKGEGTVQFTCYNPYAHTPNWVWNASYAPVNKDGRLSTSYDQTVYTSKDQWIASAGLSSTADVNMGDIPAPFIVTGASGEVKVSGNVIKINGTGTWNSKLGIVSNGSQAVPYTGNACATIKPRAAATCSSGRLDYEYWYY